MRKMRVLYRGKPLLWDKTLFSHEWRVFLFLGASAGSHCSYHQLIMYIYLQRDKKMLIRLSRMMVDIFVVWKCDGLH